MDDKNLPSAPPAMDARHFVNGAGRRVYVFDFQGQLIENPAMNPATGEGVSPQTYGFVVREFAGGRTAWARDFGNGTMLALNPSTKSHHLEGSDAVRVMFVAPGGELLQDRRIRIAAARRAPELATVRVTVNVAIDLLGATPEAGKNAVLRHLGRALGAGATANGEVEILQHSFELSQVVAEGTTAPDYSNTNFSQLLGL